MKETMAEFEKEVTELVDICKAEVGRCMFDENVDERGFTLMQKIFKLTDTSMKLMREHTEMMNSMNDKLDRLLKKLDE